jgi:uncharacterized membrane protein YhaH (DUF805 family)
MNWMTMPLRRYADFSGRSRRKEYWMFHLGILLFYLAIGILVGITFPLPANADGLEGESPVVWLIVALIGLSLLALIIPLLAVQIRRFHDQDYSGWMVLLGLIPYIGSLIVLVFMCLEGTTGDNRYGPDPKAGDLSYSQIP